MMKPKLFRDPVHDIIAFDMDVPWERMLLALIDTQEIQRLRHIRQLGLAYVVYPGAEHSRFAHSLGVTHLARRILHQVSSGQPEEEAAFCTMGAALLHDVGHGPFSHAIEKVTHVHHEEISRAILRDPDSEVNAVLRSFDPALPSRLDALLHPHAPPSYARDIVSSQLDADRLDYILRDGHMTGVRIGLYDLERIVSTLEARASHLLVSYRAKEAVEGYLLARFHMFKQVYLHKAVRSAEKMLEAAMARAAELLRAGDDSVDVPEGPFRKLLLGLPIVAMEFVRLDDHDIWYMIKGWPRSRGDILRGLALGLNERNLYKTFEVSGDDERGAGGTIAAVAEAIGAAGGDPRYHLLIDRAGDAPYKPYIPGASSKQQPLMVKTPEGEVRMEECSDLIHLLGSAPYLVQRMCFPERFRAIVERVLPTD